MLIRKNIQLTEEQNEALRKLSFDTRLSESEHIRIALEKYLKEAFPMFERNSEWTGYSITKSGKGFVVSFWSRIQGEIDGAKYLYQFDKDFTPGTDLEASWNDSMTYGEYLAGTIREQYKSAKELEYKTNIKCLTKGNRVN